jgi:hypothetical protein
VKYQQPILHIDSGLTSPHTVTDKTAYVDGLIFNAAVPGTNWVLSIQDRATPPHVIAGPVKLSSLDPPYKVTDYPEPPRMEGGITVVHSGTPGSADIWFFYWEEGQ